VNLMPHSIFKRLSLSELIPSNLFLQLADRSIKYPFGHLEHAPTKVGQFYVPLNFVILDMSEDSRTQIISGRPFLATVECK